MTAKKPTGAKRGRPPGPSMYDNATMRRLADKMVGRPTKFLSTAIRASLPEGVEATDTLIRRVRRHWRDNKTTLMQEANDRAREKVRARIAGLPAHVGTGGLAGVSEAMRAVMGDMSGLSAAAEAMRSVAGLPDAVRAAIGPMSAFETAQIEMRRAAEMIEQSLRPLCTVEMAQTELRRATEALRPMDEIATSARLAIEQSLGLASTRSAVERAMGLRATDRIYDEAARIYDLQADLKKKGLL
jgi:hypothetical protein